MKSPVIISNTENQHDNSKLVLFKENQQLKERVRELEEQCRNFEKKVTF